MKVLFLTLLIIHRLQLARCQFRDTVAMKVLGRVKTNSCAIDCFDYYSYSVFYTIYEDNGYCCRSSYKLFSPECTLSSSLASYSTESMKTDVMKYVLCQRDDTLCGSAYNLSASTSYTSVSASGFKYSDNNYCYYYLELTATESALYDYIQIYVDYFFASSFYIVNGNDIYTASNKTTAQIESYYLIPTKDSSNGTNTIYFISVPDSIDAFDMILKFKYRLYSGASDLIASSSYDSTFSDPGNTIELSVMDFALICSFGGVGAIGLSILIVFGLNKLQYKMCPPKSYEDELKEEQYKHQQNSSIDEEDKKGKKKSKDDEKKKNKKNDYDNTLESDYRKTTPPEPTLKKKPRKH